MNEWERTTWLNESASVRDQVSGNGTRSESVTEQSQLAQTRILWNLHFPLEKLQTCFGNRRGLGNPPGWLDARLGNCTFALHFFYLRRTGCTCAFADVLFGTWLARQSGDRIDSDSGQLRRGADKRSTPTSRQNWYDQAADQPSSPLKPLWRRSSPLRLNEKTSAQVSASA